MHPAQLIATVHRLPRVDRPGLDDRVSWLELRADLLGDTPPSWTGLAPSNRWIFNLRSSTSGGRFQGSPEERKRRLIHAAAHFDLVTLEAETDLAAEVLAAIPPHQRLVAWYGAPTDVKGLQERFHRMSRVPARFYLLVPEALEVSDGLAPLRFLQKWGRSDIAAFASGPAGLWTRLLAPRLGAPLVFGDRDAGGPHGFPLARLIADFGLPVLPPLKEIFGIAGDPILQSPSPRFHNEAYRALDRPALFLPFPVADFDAFYREFLKSKALAQLGWPLRGLVVIAPNKEAAARLADQRSPMVARTGVANVFHRRGGRWRAETTDDLGLLGPLRKRGIPLKNVPVAVLGCGGSGRTAAAALREAGARVTLVNRTRETGARAARELGVPFQTWEDFDPGAYAIVVHATPAGRHVGPPPFDPARMDRGALLAEYLISEQPSRLVAEARRRGIATIDGMEILENQAKRQFTLLTGQNYPCES